MSKLLPILIVLTLSACGREGEQLQYRCGDYRAVVETGQCWVKQ